MERGLSPAPFTRKGPSRENFLCWGEKFLAFSSSKR